LRQLQLGINLLGKTELNWEIEFLKELINGTKSIANNI